MSYVEVALGGKQLEESQDQAIVEKVYNSLPSNYLRDRMSFTGVPSMAESLDAFLQSNQKVEELVQKSLTESRQQQPKVQKKQTGQSVTTTVTTKPKTTATKPAASKKSNVITLDDSEKFKMSDKAKRKREKDEKFRQDHQYDSDNGFVVKDEAHVDEDYIPEAKSADSSEAPKKLMKLEGSTWQKSLPESIQNELMFVWVFEMLNNPSAEKTKAKIQSWLLEWFRLYRAQAVRLNDAQLGDLIEFCNPDACSSTVFECSPIEKTIDRYRRCTFSGQTLPTGSTVWTIELSNKLRGENQKFYFKQRLMMLHFKYVIMFFTSVHTFFNKNIDKPLAIQGFFKMRDIVRLLHDDYLKLQEGVGDQ